MTGATGVGAVMAACRQEGRAALVGYLPVGFPDVPASVAAMVAMVENGVDVVEVGVPYSDPLMDGPVIQSAVETALRGGVRPRHAIEATTAVAAAGAPALLMSYWNPVDRYGVPRFAADLAAAGGAGLITPDLIPDEAADWIAASDAHGLDRVFLVAPSSTPKRLASTTAACRGFVYAASTMGVTGVRTSVGDAARVLVERTRPVTELPICVGLGVSTPEQAAQVASFADGVIVGSAFVRAFAQAPGAASGVLAVGELARRLSDGIRSAKAPRRHVVTALSALPSPTQGVWHLGPLPLRAYALCILVGIAVAIWLGQRRWVARGGRETDVVDIAVWAVPFGLVGGRLYHVITSPEAYFGEGGHPWRAFAVWEGGLGIWGAVILGGVGAWIGCRRNGILLPPMGDALVPGIVFAQAIGRWGNWFNNELYGRATDLPWGLTIHEWDLAAGHAIRDSDGVAVVLGVFHPAFLYESLWDILVGVALILADRRFRMGHGRLFALYVMLYTVGRGWIETLRIDTANHILGQRLNVWVALVLFCGALVYLVVSRRRRPGRETQVYRDVLPQDVGSVSAPDL